MPANRLHLWSAIKLRSDITIFSLMTQVSSPRA